MGEQSEKAERIRVLLEKISHLPLLYFNQIEWQERKIEKSIFPYLICRPNIVEYTDFYNVSLDHMDLMAEYYAWQNPERPGQFSYCQVSTPIKLI